MVVVVSTTAMLATMTVTVMVVVVSTTVMLATMTVTVMVVVLSTTAMLATVLEIPTTAKVKVAMLAAIATFPRYHCLQ